MTRAAASTRTRLSEPRRSSSDLAIVVSRYNESITSRLLDGAVETYQSRGGSPAELTILDAPGSFDLTAVCDAAASSGRFAGIVALGCIIKGDTSHDQHIASAVVHGLTNITILSGVPIALGVLTVNTVQQARDRAGGKHGNKGAEAMNALLMTLAEVAKLARPITRADARARVHAGAPALTDKAGPSARPARGEGR